MKKFLLAAALTACAGSASAITVVFESFNLAANDSTDLGVDEVIGGIEFSKSDQDGFIQLVGVGQTGSGNAGDAFWPIDSPNPNTFGTTFISGDFAGGNTGINMASTGLDFTSITFDIVDIDGSGGDLEKFVVSYYLDGAMVGAADVVDANDAAAGDAKVTTFTRTGLFDTVKIAATTPNGTRNIGFGLDNISATVVPLPAGAVLMLTAMGGLGVMRVRRRKA